MADAGENFQIEDYHVSKAHFGGDNWVYVIIEISTTEKLTFIRPGDYIAPWTPAVEIKAEFLSPTWAVGWGIT